MTYRELLEKLSNLTPDQLDSTVTVELTYTNECISADFDICAEEHDSLEENHPVITIDW
jgi:hypothetical protein